MLISSNKEHVCPNCGGRIVDGFFALHWETGVGEFSGRWKCEAVNHDVNCGESDRD